MLRVHFWRSSRTTLLIALFGSTFAYALWHWLGHVETSHTTRRKRKIPPGLVNTGNTCFMNSLLQSFSSTTPFVAWLKQFSSRVRNTNTERQYLADTLLQTIRVLNGEVESPSYHDASDLLQEMAGRGWQISSEEQDTHEFFHALVTTLREEHQHFCSSREIMDLSAIKDLIYLPLKQSGNCMNIFSENIKSRDACPFRGSLASILRCGTCGHHNPTKCDEFDSLSVPLLQTTSYRMSLMECLEKFMSSEVLSNVDCGSCTSLEDDDASAHASTSYVNSFITEFGRVAKSRKSVHQHQGEDEIRNEQNSSKLCKDYRNTPLSTLQFQHYFVHNTMRCNKMNNNMKNSEGEYCKPIKRNFCRSLCLAKLPKCLCIHLQRLVWIGGNPMKRMDVVLFPEILDITPFTYRSKLLQTYNTRKSASTKQSHQTVRNLYRLASVVVHVGNWSTNGHFYAYRKGITKDGQTEWFFTSDTLVRKATRDEVFACPAYMLVYEKVQKLNCLGQS